MDERKKPDVEEAFVELTDEQAIAVMEGRVPAQDSERVEEAARVFVDTLMKEETRSESAGGEVVQLFARQPWLRMAASVVFGVAVTVLILGRGQPPTPTGSATANVFYLEVLRGSNDVTNISIKDSDQLVSLIAYPHFGDAEALSVRVEREAGSQQGSEWETILQEKIPSGLQDAVVVNVPARKLSAGDYRLRVLTADDMTDQLVVAFHVSR